MGKVKEAFTFEGKIDLTEWDMPTTEGLVDDICENINDKISVEVEKQLKRVKDKLGDITYFARQIAAEALQISFQKGIGAHFWSIPGQPEIITIDFEDFNVDGFTCEINLRQAVEEAILRRCANDGYLHPEYEAEMISFANMLRECANIVETSVYRKNG